MQINETKKIGDDFNELTTLEIGQKYTLLVMSDFGIGTVAMQITLVEVKVAAYAQYSESIQLIFKLKGKRNLRGLRLYGSKSFAIWKEWLNIDTNAFSEPTISSGLVCRQSRYLSFDVQYMTDAIASTAAAPLFSKTN